MSCWGPLSGNPLFDVTPEEAATAVGEAEAEAEAKASIERLNSQQLVSRFDASNGLQQVARLAKCDKIVKVLDAERPVSSNTL